MPDPTDALDPTVSPGPACACRSALNAVIPPHINGDASSKVSPSGIRATASCGATMYSAYPPSYDIPTIVRLTTVGEVTPPAVLAGEVDATGPADADPLADLPDLDPSTDRVDDPGDPCPGTRGSLVPNKALRGIASPPQIPQACTFTRICPGPGSGTGMSTTTKGPPAC